METFSMLLTLCAGNSLVTGEFLAQRPVRGALMFSLICAWISVWANNHEAGDLGSHCAHYDVIVMLLANVAAQADWASEIDQRKYLSNCLHWLHMKCWTRYTFLLASFYYIGINTGFWWFWRQFTMKSNLEKNNTCLMMGQFWSDM